MVCYVGKYLVFCKTHYPGLDSVDVVELLDTGERLYCPYNRACSKCNFVINN